MTLIPLACLLSNENFTPAATTATIITTMRHVKHSVAMMMYHDIANHAIYMLISIVSHKS